MRPGKPMTLLDCTLCGRPLNHGLSVGASFDSADSSPRRLVTYSYAPTAPAAARIAMLPRCRGRRRSAAAIPADAAA